MKVFYIVTTVIFIIIMFVIIYVINISYTDTSSSPTSTSIYGVPPNCPDYWIDSTGDGVGCISTGPNITKECKGTLDFSGDSCEKLQKALACPGLIWDGITYGNNPKVSIESCNLNKQRKYKPML